MKHHGTFTGHRAPGTWHLAPGACALVLAVALGASLAMAGDAPSGVAGDAALPKDVPGLEKALTGEGPTALRAQSARELGRRRDPKTLSVLLSVLHDRNREVRWAAIEALGDLGLPGALDALVAELERREAYGWGPRLAANALGDLGDPRAVGPLVLALKHEDIYVRRVAAIALVRIGDPSGLEAVDALIAADEAAGTGGSGALGDLRRIRIDYQRRREPPGVAAPGAQASANPLVGAGLWSGVRIGQTTVEEARRLLGVPEQETPSTVLFPGTHARSPFPVEQAVLNIDQRGVVDSVFVFPTWGTVDTDMRRLFNEPPQASSYGAFLEATGRTRLGAGTGANGKLHFIVPESPCDYFKSARALTVYDATPGVPGQRIVRLVIFF